MQVFEWPARFKPEDGTILVSFTDFPEVLTEGSTEEEARANAADALAVAVAERVDAASPLPANRVAKRGEQPVALTPLDALKVALRLVMRQENVTQRDLAARIGKTQQHVQRSLRLDHHGKVEQLTEMLAALGGQIVSQLRLPEDRAA